MMLLGLVIAGVVVVVGILIKENHLANLQTKHNLCQVDQLLEEEPSIQQPFSNIYSSCGSERRI
ncbi:MAG: hypothetical protein Q8P67_04975 [archaeon]|nr:hypothetical protein [archaeon]